MYLLTEKLIINHWHWLYVKKKQKSKQNAEKFLIKFASIFFFFLLLFFIKHRITQLMLFKCLFYFYYLFSKAKLYSSHIINNVCCLYIFFIKNKYLFFLSSEFFHCRKFSNFAAFFQQWKLNKELLLFIRAFFDYRITYFTWLFNQ